MPDLPADLDLTFIARLLLDMRIEMRRELRAPREELSIFRIDSTVSAAATRHLIEDQHALFEMYRSPRNRIEALEHPDP
jgi:hypothetical protein